MLPSVCYGARVSATVRRRTDDIGIVTMRTRPALTAAIVNGLIVLVLPAVLLTWMDRAPNTDTSVTVRPATARSS
jgi:hypothetical protein